MYLEILAVWCFGLWFKCVVIKTLFEVLFIKVLLCRLHGIFTTDNINIWKFSVLAFSLACYKCACFWRFVLFVLSVAFFSYFVSSTVYWTICFQTGSNECRNLGFKCWILFFSKPSTSIYLIGIFSWIYPSVYFLEFTQ